jgi:hypothetical protein
MWRRLAGSGIIVATWEAARRGLVGVGVKNARRWYEGESATQATNEKRHLQELALVQHQAFFAVAYVAATRLDPSQPGYATQAKNLIDFPSKEVARADGYPYLKQGYDVFIAALDRVTNWKARKLAFGDDDRERAYAELGEAAVKLCSRLDPMLFGVE